MGTRRRGPAVVVVRFKDELPGAVAARILEADVDLRTIQILMGHASISSTAHYLHLTRKTLANTRSPLDLLDLTQLPNPSTARYPET